MHSECLCFCFLSHPRFGHRQAPEPGELRKERWVKFYALSKCFLLKPVQARALRQDGKRVGCKSDLRKISTLILGFLPETSQVSKVPCKLLRVSGVHRAGRVLRILVPWDFVSQLTVWSGLNQNGGEGRHAQVLFRKPLWSVSLADLILLDNCSNVFTVFALTLRLDFASLPALGCYLNILNYFALEFVLCQ